MELTPTSYALLGLLNVKPWSTYELAHQAQRSLHYFLPRAERHLYAEVKRLAEAGYASSDVQYTGKRRTTSYAITPAGRRALKAWLHTEPAPLLLEAEVVTRAFFADAGRKQDLLDALEVARRQAITVQAELGGMARASAAGDTPFPERTPLGAISMRFVADLYRTMEAWAEWAAAEVATWDDAQGKAWMDGARAVMADIAGRATDDDVG